MSKKHDDFWRNEATREDYADPNISTDLQVTYIVGEIELAGAVKDGGHILEFGCGYGRLTREVKKAFPEAMVIGVDISPKILAEAEAYSAKSKVRPFYYRADNIKNTLAKDAIYCAQVLQHMPNDRKCEFIQDAADALKPGGVLVFQYVEGDSDTFLKHDAKFADVSDWCRKAGFTISNVAHNLAAPRWTWVTAVKE